jgi:hypothetical protein
VEVDPIATGLGGEPEPKDPLEVLRRDATAVVLDGNLELAVAGATRTDDDAALSGLRNCMVGLQGP